MNDFITLLLMLLGTLVFFVLASFFGHLSMDDVAMRPSDAPNIYIRLIIQLIIIGFLSVAVLSIVLMLFAGKE